MHPNSRIRLAVTLTATALAGAGSLFGLAGPASAGSGGFTPGDVVVYTVGTSGGATPSSTSGPVSLVDYAVSGSTATPGYSVTFSSNPTADTPTSHALVESGTATNDGELTLSADGQYLYATGYDAASGVASITSATSTPRTVGIVSAGGTVDSSTSLADSTTEGQNFRSATGPTAGPGGFYVGGGAGTATAADGAASASYLDTSLDHQVLIANGTLYESTTTNIDQVGSGLPVTGSPSVTPLIASPPTGFSPDAFAFVTLGTGTAPDTLYVADTGNNAVEKYSYVGGAWVLKGSVTVPIVTGLTASVSNGVATIFTTNATSATKSGKYSDKYNTLLSDLTDSSGAGGTLPSATTVTLLATAPTGESFKGVAFAPTGSPNTGQTPETPFVLFLPLLAVAGLAGYLAVHRRKAVA